MRSIFCLKKSENIQLSKFEDEMSQYMFLHLKQLKMYFIFTV